MRNSRFNKDFLDAIRSAVQNAAQKAVHFVRVALKDGGIIPTELKNGSTKQYFKDVLQRRICQGKAYICQHRAAMLVGGLSLVLVCVCTGASFTLGDRAAQESIPSVESSSIAQTVFRKQVVEQAALDAAEMGGSYLTQSAERSAQSVLAKMYITVDALQEVDDADQSAQAFSLIEGQSSGQHEEKDMAALDAAIDSMESEGYSVGCFFLNLNTGQGIAYNLDTRIYGASSFKGIYAAYLSEHLADGKSGLSSSAISLMDASVRYSDNNAFSNLRNRYDGSGFTDWLESCGVDSDIAHDTHFPRYSARESALLWFHIYTYLQSDTQAAKHLREIYTQTNLSLIRDTVEEVLGSAGSSDVSRSAVVMNKAGWIASSPRFSGLCDAGLIECDGTTYLMSVMSSAPDSAGHREKLTSIIEELFKLR
ncbi:uncharacterized protein BN494_00842 [Eggerthella sp. CAG:1427]|nr:uncharacterized protein BN494_00842 [Eggerthella sp. CAG:1427]